MRQSKGPLLISDDMVPYIYLPPDPYPLVPTPTRPHLQTSVASSLSCRLGEGSQMVSPIVNASGATERRSIPCRGGRAETDAEAGEAAAPLPPAKAEEAAALLPPGLPLMEGSDRPEDDLWPSSPFLRLIEVSGL